MGSRTLVGFMLLLAVAAAGAPVGTQPATQIPKIGSLAPGTQVSFVPLIAAIRQGLQELGYVEGKSVLLRSASPTARPNEFPSSPGNWLPSSWT